MQIKDTTNFGAVIGLGLLLSFLFFSTRHMARCFRSCSWGFFLVYAGGTVRDEWKETKQGKWTTNRVPNGRYNTIPHFFRYDSVLVSVARPFGPFYAELSRKASAFSMGLSLQLQASLLVSRHSRTFLFSRSEERPLEEADTGFYFFGTSSPLRESSFFENRMLGVDTIPTAATGMDRHSLLFFLRASGEEVSWEIKIVQWSGD